MGRGVFALRAFRAGEVIEVCPALVVPADQWRHVKRTTLFDYVFDWPHPPGSVAVAFGFGSLYNHDAEGWNARFTLRPARREIVLRAAVPIGAGAQILIDYQYGDADPRTSEFRAISRVLKGEVA
jgi:uncharacterized protein